MAYNPPMTKAAKVFTSGLAVVDFIFELDQFPAAPQKYIAERGSCMSGGPAVNAAIAVTRLGGQAALGARVGADLLGALALEELAAAAVDTAQVHRAPQGVTAFSAVYLDLSLIHI